MENDFKINNLTEYQKQEVNELPCQQRSLKTDKAQGEFLLFKFHDHYNDDDSSFHSL